MRRKITITVILLTLLPTLIIGCAVNYYAQKTVRDTKNEMLAGIVKMMDFHITRYYDKVLVNINEKAASQSFRRILLHKRAFADPDGKKLREIRRIILEDVSLPSVGGAIIDTSGRIIVSNQPSEEGLMLDKTTLYQTIMNGETSYMGFMNNADNMEKMEVAVPILDENGKIIGIFRQIVSLDGLMSYLENLNIGKMDYAFLIRKNGSFIARYNADYQALLYNEYQNRSTLEQLASDFKNDRLGNNKGFVEFQVKGSDYMGVYKKIDQINCIAVAAINRDAMVSDVEKMKQFTFIIGIFIVLLSGIVGYFLGDMILKPISEINRKLKKIADGDLTVRCSYEKNNEYRELSSHINNIAENLQKSERELRMSARIDNLTHLPNRYAIYEVLDTLLYKHPNQALLLLDLDGFSQINDNLGHDIGDRILMEVGDILRSLPQHICYSSRIGGDEFLVFITNWTADRYPEKVAEKIIRKIESIRFIDEIHVDISVSIGIEYINGEKIDKKKRIKHSDFAMHKAKSTGKNSYIVYYPYLQKDN